MKIVVIGGTGLIGTNVVNRLRGQGHDVLAASSRTGVNTVTGEGLAAALAGAQVVIDVANSPSFEDQAVMEFFHAAGTNIRTAEIKAKIRHHVALSVVGTDRMQSSGYFRAKLVQENLIKASPIPYTIVRATQFFEFLGSIAQSATSSDGTTVRLPSAGFQPIHSDDVASLVAEVALHEPLNRIIEIAGPEPGNLDEIIRQYLRAKRDPRTVTTDESAHYFGIPLGARTLIPDAHSRLGRTRFVDWLKQAGVA